MKILAAVPTALVKQLVALLKKAKDTYTNSKRGVYYKAKRDEVPAEYRKWLAPTKGEITDPVYDRLEDELRRLDPKNKLLTDVGAPVKNKKTKMALPFNMPSLLKIKKLDAIQAWLDSHPGPYLVGNKVDGVSIGLQFRTGEAPLGFTRGVGDVGGNISFKLDHLKIPKLKGNYDLRGEIVIPNKLFAKEWHEDLFENPKDGFKNARGMASGIINSDSLHPGLSDAKVYIYEVVSPRGVPSKQLLDMKAKGFHIVPFKVYNKLTPALLKTILTERKAKGDHEMDGLVIVQNKKNPAPLKSEPDWAVAYKDEEGDDSAVVSVVEVQWNVTRTGRVFPRIMIEPVQLKGVTVTYCTGKSGKTIEANGIGPGARILVRRAGDVIPDFIKTVKRVKPQMPNRKLVGDWEWNGENIDLVDSEGGHADSSTTVKIKALEFFFVTIGVEDFRYATISKFVEKGYDSVQKILQMNQSQFIAVSGSVKVLGKVYAAIHAATTNVPLPRLMYASGAFGRSFGERRCASILKALPNVLKMSKAPKKLYAAVMEVHGFHDTTATQFVEGLPKFVDWLKTVPSVSYELPKAVKQKGAACAGQYVVFTGVRDAALQQAIVENGGEVGDSRVKMTVLVAKNPAENTDKLNAARAAGIPIYTIDQFKKKFKL